MHKVSTAGKRPGAIAREIVEEYLRRGAVWKSERRLARRIAAEIRKAAKRGG